MQIFKSTFQIILLTSISISSIKKKIKKNRKRILKGKILTKTSIHLTFYLLTSGQQEGTNSLSLRTFILLIFYFFLLTWTN